MEENTLLTTVTDATFRQEVLENSGPVLVEFGAEWCGPCHILAPIIEELASEFRGKIKICMLDMDANPRATQDYGIGKIPTLLFFRDGRVVDHLVGVAPKEEIATKFNALLQVRT